MNRLKMEARQDAYRSKLNGNGTSLILKNYVTSQYTRESRYLLAAKTKLSYLAQTLKPGSHIIIDSTGLKVYGKDEWHQDQHGVNARRTWRKLHIVIDENSKSLLMISLIIPMTIQQLPWIYWFK